MLKILIIDWTLTGLMISRFIARRTEWAVANYVTTVELFSERPPKGSYNNHNGPLW